MGYCKVGRVVSVGAGVTEFKLGDRVASNGAFAEMVCVPKNLCAPIRHENWNSLYRYIAKHNEYSDWEARVYFEGGGCGEVEPKLFGTQAERRRWLKKKFIRLPGFPLITFCYHYVFKLGFLDGRAGLIYCTLKGIQRFHSKAKLYELERKG